MKIINKFSTDLAQIVKSIEFRRQPAVNAKKLLVHDGRQG
jgi:hypothetical protein